MTNMVEKVAEALWAAQEPRQTAWAREIHRRDYERLARAALEALREPTEAMLDASFIDDGRGSDVDWVLATKVWQAMIDAALSPPQSGDAE